LVRVGIMPNIQRWAWSLAGVGIAILVFASYLGVRSLAGSAPGWLELVIVMASLASGAVIWGLAAHQQHSQRDLRLLQKRLSKLSEDPLAADRPLPPDLELLAGPLEELAGRLRQALSERQHAETALQSLVGKADSEEGESYSLVHRNVNETSLTRDLICRLSPDLCWLAATPALQRFLGYRIVEINTRPFFDLVLAEDVPALKAQLDAAMKKGEGHNVPFRIRQRNGPERNILMDVITRYTPEGKPLSLRCFLLDVTDRVLTESELRQRTQQLTKPTTACSTPTATWKG
jgi:PAS domain S-box-containing protein